MHSERLRTMSSQLYLEEKPDDQHCVDGYKVAWGRWQRERRVVAWYQVGERMAMFQPTRADGLAICATDVRAWDGVCSRRVAETTQREEAI
jgi:hypothetical protein